MDADSDGDHVPDLIEGHDANENGEDDWANGDGLFTGQEGTKDTDGDGLLDVFDTDNGGLAAAVQDKDGDGTADFQDTDDDDDGILTSAEDNNTNNDWSDDFTQGGGVIPDYLYNPDADGDGINDDVDIDSDNDGILNVNEDSGSGYDPSGDQDSDGTPNYLDSSNPGNPYDGTDSNGDGIIDIFDSDLDGIPDFLDLDSDNDGVLDIVEAGGTDSDNNGVVDGVFADGDTDGWSNVFDSDNGGTALDNPDSDGDGIYDAADKDSDNDGIPDIIENGGTDTNGDGMADNTADTDKDGILDAYDIDSSNSPLSVDDKDNDGYPNAIDLDSDDDGIADVIEAGGTDADGNGKLDSFADTDNDGFNDVADTDNGGTMLTNGDQDGDGYKNYLDIDSDGDGITDIVEAQSTAGYQSPLGTDSDFDGLDDRFDPDNGGTAIVPVNTDGKTGADYLDTDSDNDGISDQIEGNDNNSDGTIDVTLTATDTDGDGLSDAVDTNTGSYDPEGSSVALQDLDGDGALDFRDTDDDDDGIPTIDEPLDLNPQDGTKDYLSNSVGNCGLKYLTVEYAGNADLVEQSTGVTGGGLALGSGDDTDAEFNDEGDILILDLTDVIPLDSAVTIKFRSSAAGTVTATITSSLTLGGTYGDAQTFTDSDNSYNTEAYTVNTTGGIRYLQIEFTSQPNGGSPPNWMLDAVAYQFYLCYSDWDNEGIADINDNDDDNDGISDLVESGGVDPSADDDSDGTANYQDADYAGFVDSNGDGVNDNFDFDLDGIPNHLDLDSDNDGIPDAVEANGGSLPADMLDDGRFSVSYMQVSGNDSDSDGWVDQYDPSDGGTELATPDTDLDGDDDYLDLDADDDGQPDYIEGYNDNENANALDDYIDRADAFESAAGTPGYYDSSLDGDGDGIPNWLEVPSTIPQLLDPTYLLYQDTDGDGLIDLFDYSDFGSGYTAPDSDNDGIPDYLDIDNQITLLPVDLLAFLVEKTDSGIHLKWSTASEIANDYFTIAKSTDGETFKEISVIDGMGDSKVIVNYEYLDRPKIAGVYYYQLSQTDYDGTTEVLGIVRATWNLNDQQVSMYPNPVENILTVNTSGVFVEGKITLIDLAGNILLRDNLQNNTSQIKLEISHLKSGIYFLMIESEGLNHRQRFIKK